MDFGSRFNFILGSASPRRQQLLKDCGFSFKTVSINADESFPPDLKAEKIAVYLSEKKAGAYPGTLQENDLLITADTIVWIENVVLNKPANEFEAKQMLQFLSGKTHEVFTGVCLTTLSRQVSFFDRTAVSFKSFSEAEIDFYIKNYQPFDKAGSYGAQDWLGLTGIHKIEGSYFNVMGLPTHKLYEEIGKL